MDMAKEATTTVADVFRDGLQRSIAAAALACLAVASAVGVWLAVLLLWPEAGQAIGPLTYGRWMPVHLDVQLFGWCSLPVVGVLMQRMLPSDPRWLEAARVALAAWLGALVAGSIAWLGGRTSGKLFLDWSGASGVVFAAAQMLLWSVLAAGWWARRRSDARRRAGRAIDAALLAVLAAVPLALYLVEKPTVYPPINPDSGGATGHSLLASSLGVVGIALLLPSLLGRPARGPIRDAAWTVAAAYAANLVVYGSIHHGNASNHELGQIAGLGTLLLWPPLLVAWFRRFSWERTQSRWLVTTGVWCVLLVIDGFVLFLPGVLTGAKFTHALVAHAHLAMAGLLTALNMLVLISLAPGSPLARALDARGVWLAWNLASLAMVAILTGIGFLEARDPLVVILGAREVTVGYLARLAAGVVMLGSAATWWWATLRPVSLGARPEPIAGDHGEAGRQPIAPARSEAFETSHA